MPGLWRSLMLAGLKFRCHQLRWRVGYTIPSFSATALDVTAGASLTSYWTPDLLLKNTGIQLAVSATTLGTDRTTVSLLVPDLGISEVHDVPGFQDAAEAVLEIDDLRLINAFNPSIGYVQRLTWEAARLYLDGVLKWTGGAIEIESPRFAASGIPLLGVPPTLAHSATVSPEFAEGSFATCPSGLDIDVASENYGAWEIKWTSDGAWQSAPIAFTLPSVGMPDDCPCELTLPESAVITAENTADVRIRGGMRLLDDCEMIAENEECDPCPPGTLSGPPQVRDVFKATRRLDTWGGSVMLLPNVEKSVRRWKPLNYRMMVLRGGFPQVKANAVTTCGPWGSLSDPEQISNIVNPEVFPAQTAILSNVGDATHPIEDTMARESIAPGSTFRRRGESVKYYQTTIVPATCDPEDPDPEDLGYPPCSLPPSQTCSVSESRTSIAWVQDGIENPYILPALDHLDDVCRYIDTICSPHWSYFAWFPANTIDTDEDGLPDSQDQWPLFGDPIPVEYWLKVRQQWGFHSALPESEQTRRRTSLPMDPLYWGHLSPIVRDQIGVHSNWWGQQNFIVDDWQPPLSRSYSEESEDLISTINCSAVAAPSGLTVTPHPFETSLTIDFDLGSLNTYPYLFPAIADRIELLVEPENVTAFQVKLVSSISGATKLLATSNGVYARPIGMDDGYAFSFQDHGAGFFPEIGVDLLPSGQSEELMVDAETATTFEMLAGRGAAKLRFEIEAEDADAPVVIRWPKLYASEATPVVIDENGFHQALAWPGGPAIRFGNFTWFLFFPVALPPGYDSPFFMNTSMVDWLRFKRLLSGVDPFDGVEDELAELLLEGVEFTTTDHADSLTLSCLIDIHGVARRFPYAVMVPTYRETPPSVGLPLPVRDPFRQPTGVLGQQSWSHAEERVLILANQEIHYWNGADRLTDPLGSWVGWKLTGHQRALTNAEEPHEVKRGTLALGEMRPWRGLFGIDSRTSSARQLDVTSEPGGRMWWAHVEEEE